MTIVVAVNVAAGVVLAADTRSAICADGPQGRQVVTTYDGAEKLVLAGGCGVLCSGAGSIGGVAVAELVREAAALPAAAPGPEGLAWRLREVCVAHCARPALPAHNPRPSLAFLIAGYRGDAPLGECWRLELVAGEPQPPAPCHERLLWAGDAADPIARLRGDLGRAGETALRRRLGDDELARNALRSIADARAWDPVHPEMPLADALELARFLVATCIGVARFTQAIATAGGQVALATVTRAEGARPR